MRRFTHSSQKGSAASARVNFTLALAGPGTGTSFRGWGPRIGVSLDPDQVHFGAHLDFGKFANRVRFQPNAEFGFRDSIRLYTFNAEAAYRFRGRWNVWSPYLGAGGGLNIKSGGNSSHTDLGLSVLGGIEKGVSNRDRFFIETKIRLNDVPSPKVTVGWTFYH